MSEFQKIKVSTDQYEFELKLAIYEGRIEFYQKTIDLIKEIIPNFIFESNDLDLLFSNPKSFLIEKIITEPTTINGIQLNKDKVFEILEDSEKLQNVVNYIEKLKRNIRVEPGASVATPFGLHTETVYISENERNLHVFAKDYEINENGEVILKQASVENLENQYSIFVKTQRQKDSYDSLMIIKAELLKLGNTYTRSHIKFIQENFIFNSHGEVLDLNFKSLHNLE